MHPLVVPVGHQLDAILIDSDFNFLVSKVVFALLFFENNRKLILWKQ